MDLNAFFVWIVLCLPYWLVNKMKLSSAYTSEFLTSSIPKKQSEIYHNSGTENDTTMILVAKLSNTHIEIFINKILIWSPHDISLIYSCWVSYISSCIKWKY